MKDRTQQYKRMWPHISSDGHPSYSPDGRLVLTDTYPNRNRIQILKILNEDFNIVIARVFSPFKYDNDTRCDLHPRWSRDGKRVYFDSVFEGHRGLYTVDVSGIRFAYPEDTGKALIKEEQNLENKGINKSKKIRIVYLMTSCKKLGPTQQTLNIIKNLDLRLFEPILITMNDEEADSRLADYLPFVVNHYFVKTGKIDIVLGKDNELCNKLEELYPDIIHTVGVFPDYAVSQIGKYKQVHTLRNYIYDDYPAKYCKVKGTILARLQLSAMKKSDKAICCSESLSKIYKEKLGFNFDFIRNGVDVDQYSAPTKGEKLEKRKALNLPEDRFIFIYTGQFIERKNIPSKETEVIMPQKYGKEKEWIDHFNYLLTYFKDKRYIKKNNKPLIIIYRPSDIPVLKPMIECWRSLAVENGFAGLEIAFQTINLDLEKDKRRELFDYDIEYQPSYAQVDIEHLGFPVLRKIKRNIDRFLTSRKGGKTINIHQLMYKKRIKNHNMMSYDKLWEAILQRKPIDSKCIPGAFVDWDNSPRKGDNARICEGATPEKFEKYMTLQIKHAKEVYKKNMIFIYAWNEWAEGGYLEPDEDNKYGYLEALRKALIANGEFPKY